MTLGSPDGSNPTGFPKVIHLDRTHNENATQLKTILMLANVDLSKEDVQGLQRSYYETYRNLLVVSG